MKCDKAFSERARPFKNLSIRLMSKATAEKDRKRCRPLYMQYKSQLCIYEVFSLSFFQCIDLKVRGSAFPKGKVRQPMHAGHGDRAAVMITTFFRSLSIVNDNIAVYGECLHD